jgi:hypothetical protein
LQINAGWLKNMLIRM